jgi:hypothetical protein
VDAASCGVKCKAHRSIRHDQTQYTGRYAAASNLKRQSHTYLQAYHDFQSDNEHGARAFVLSRHCEIVVLMSNSLISKSAQITYHLSLGL